MSERGSFVTEYIHCPNCLNAVQEQLVDSSKYLTGITIPSWEYGKTLPIVAGKIGGGHLNEEFNLMDELGQGMQLCHPVRIAVLADSGESKVFTFKPPQDMEESDAE